MMARKIKKIVFPPTPVKRRADGCRNGRGTYGTCPRPALDPPARFPFRDLGGYRSPPCPVHPAEHRRRCAEKRTTVHPREPRRERRAAPVRKPLWAIFILSFACAFAAPALGVHLSPLGERGEGIFQQKCSACHTVGGGRSAGPDLAGVTSRRDRAWLDRIITAPGELFDSGDPEAKKLIEEFRGIRMPDLKITAEEADAILAYLAEAGTPPAAAAQVPPTGAGERPSAEGDPEIGSA